MHETPEGYLVCVGVPIARTGEQVYGRGETPLEVGEDGLITIIRDSAEVFRPETLASFEGKPVTVGHPEIFVSPENWNELAKGIVQNVRRGTGDQANDAIADLLITDSETKSLVQGGLREVSCGYEAEYLQLGIGRGTQKKIVGNHVALVTAGRAGNAYAINDHKGKGILMSMKETIKSIFGKAQDEALAAVEGKEEKPVTNDAIMNALSSLSEKVAKLSKVTDAEVAPVVTPEVSKEAAKEEVAPEASMEDRLKKLEDAVAKITEMLADEEDDSDAEEVEGSQELEEFKDGEPDEKDDKKDNADDAMEGAMVGDTASRVEILAPGMKLSKNVKAKALLAAYGTTDGKAVINQLTGGKRPVLTNAKTVDTLFVAASECLKASRVQNFSRTKVNDFRSTIMPVAGDMSAEEHNRKMTEYWAKK